MKKTPNLFTLRQLLDAVNGASAYIDGRWVPARPIGFWAIRHRMRCAWLVWMGEADAVVWPERAPFECKFCNERFWTPLVESRHDCGKGIKEDSDE